MHSRCKVTHTGFWEYIIALALRNEGTNTFSISDMLSKVRELEQSCLLPKVTQTTIIEQLTSRCCAQGSTSFGSLLNYFNRERAGVYSLFDPEIHTAIPERAGKPYTPTNGIVKHIRKRHLSDLRCVMRCLSVDQLPFML